jgi:hypothetical protein
MTRKHWVISSHDSYQNDDRGGPDASAASQQASTAISRRLFDANDQVAGSISQCQLEVAPV